MRQQNYPFYKSSGIEWIGKIPGHWTVQRLKAATLYNINGIWGDDPKEDGSDLLCVRVADFDMLKLGISTTSSTFRNVKANHALDRLLSSNDVLIEKSGGSDSQPVGRAVSFNLDSPAVCSNFVGKIVPNMRLVVPRFLVYMFYNAYQHGLNKRSIKQTTGIQNLDLENYLSELVVYPTVKEQKRIVAYLDEKTTLIDETIRRKQRLIELILEERIALINSAITHGLNPDTPLVDCREEIIGNIPSHWQLKKLKRVIAKFSSGITPKGGAEVYQKTGVPLLRSQNIYSDGLKLDDIAFISQETHEGMANSKVKPGDVLLNITGASIGRCFFVDTSLGEANVNQHVCILRPNKNIMTQYLYFFLTSTLGQIQIEQLQTGANREGLNFEQLKGFLLPLPPLDEQDNIVTTLMELGYKSKTLVNTLTKEIKLLREFRSALISEVITGKKCLLSRKEVEEIRRNQETSS